MKFLKKYLSKYSFLGVIFLFTLLLSCNEKDRGIPMEPVEDVESVQMQEGEVVRSPFVDKGGHTHEGIYDYYFVTEDSRYLIQFKEDYLMEEQAQALLGKQVQALLFLENGTMDTGTLQEDSLDNLLASPVQSRVGEYCLVRVIKISQP